jgi:hypothetical protein
MQLSEGTQLPERHSPEEKELPGAKQLPEEHSCLEGQSFQKRGTAARRNAAVRRDTATGETQLRRERVARSDTATGGSRLSRGTEPPKKEAQLSGETKFSFMTKCHTGIDGYVAETATSITVYRLPTKENKLPFSVSVCSIQAEVAVSY